MNKVTHPESEQLLRHGYRLLKDASVILNQLGLSMAAALVVRCNRDQLKLGIA